MASFNSIIRSLSRRGFIVTRHSHSHPDTIDSPDTPMPSGHYTNGKPVPIGHKDYLKGNAEHARQMRKLPGVEFTRFDVSI